MNAATTTPLRAAAELGNDTIKVVEEITTTTTQPGFFGRLVKKHPFLMTVTTLAAAGGAGYVAYDQLRKGVEPEKVADTIETVAAAIGKLRA